MTNIVVRRYLGRSRLAEELVEDVLIAEHRSAMFAREVEELVNECIELEKMSKGTWEYVLDLLFSEEQPDDFDELGKSMKTATSKTVEVFGQVGKLIEEAKTQKRAIKNSADFWIARQEMERIQADIEEKFPPLNEQMIQASLEAFKQGEFVTLEDLLREA
jgi:hypothetical protein